MKTTTDTAFAPGTRVLIQGRSSFAGTTGIVTGISESITSMVTVTLTVAGRLHENVSFMPHELHPVAPALLRANTITLSVETR